ncbi:hypothetical protein [Nocardiopsis suaedae]|uniref:DUF222 domain-containing protein n=1 Tax=Nocardiopsis suaedae TaxID=3018444 RepID=A0ABT4TR70_9ACTN|nr:hypothetical protein [Nocardiopsis suaedae]MDA2807188.1 hypothetical protein [Nocardiopsis suaedae]
MIDLQEQVGRVHNPDVRPLVAEAVRAYSIGSARSAIILTWTAVCADLILKFERLADDGDGKAKEFASKIENVRSLTDVSVAIPQMQKIESDLLKEALDRQIIDTLDLRELERLKHDRNLCAHPSLTPLGEFFAPTTEYARAHLTSALNCLLTVPPSQGKRALERFQQHVTSSSFTDTPGFIARTFYDHTKEATRRQMVALAVKHAMLELDVGDLSVNAIEMARRMAACVHAFVERDRGQVAERMQGLRDDFARIEGAKMVRALGRLGDLDIFREAIGEETRTRINDLIQTQPSLADEELLSLTSLEEVRAAFPTLEVSFAQTPSDAVRAQAIGRRPSAFFTGRLARMLREARGFRAAEAITTDAVLPSARFLATDQLADILSAWADNMQCREASAMPANAVALHATTSHLRPDDQPVWEEFIRKVQEENPPPHYYAYEDLAAAVEFRIF